MTIKNRINYNSQRFFSVIGTHYYPVDGNGFFLEIGENFNGKTELNIGLSLGEKQ